MASRSVRCTFLDASVPDVEVSLPATVLRPAGISSFAVVTFGRVDLELNDSHRDFLAEYFATVGAREEDEIHLRSGRTVRLGRVGGRHGSGHCFAIEAGARRLLGTSPPTVALRTLASWLSDLHVTSTQNGLKINPTAGRMSAARPPHVVLDMVLRSGQRVLVDVRPAHRKTAATVGLAVAGGRLSRISPPDRAEYLTLDAWDHVVHVLPPTADDLDEVADLGSRLIVRALSA